MANNEEEQELPAKATDEDIQKEVGDDSSEPATGDTITDGFVYFQSSTIISILIIVIISLVCVLATSFLIQTVVHSRGVTRRLSIYLGLQANRTLDESILTYWVPKHLPSEQPIETSTAIVISSSTSRPPSRVRLSETEKKAQIIFRNYFLPALFILAIVCGVLAFCMRRHHHHYPAWGARPKRPKNYITVELEKSSK